MKINIPKKLYYELAIKNINIMEYTANPYLADNKYSENIELELDRIPFFYAKELLDNTIAFFENEVKGIDTELENQNLRDYDLTKLEDKKKSLIADLKSINLYIANRSGSLKQIPKTLNQMFFALKHFLDEELPKSENHWLYKYDSKTNYSQPYLVTRIEFYAKQTKNDKDVITIFLNTIKNNALNKHSIDIGYEDMKRHKKNPKELLMGMGFHLEEEIFLNNYNITTKDFLEKAVMQNREFIDEDGVRYINDNLESVSYKTKVYEESVSSFFGETPDLKRIPIVPTIYVYNLNEYAFEYKDVRLINPYEYDKNIEEKLILPTDHKNLINILLSEEYQSHDADFIKGKGNGTLILAMGKAGLGKTLTSEVYAERKQIPRLKVHASQLGTDETKIEKRLKEFMSLAERWKCILLIDEADVYIRKRDNDVQHNAIVATMLQQIEYFNGILFMTTNRTEDVDEAILSRCSAILKYSLPTQEMALNLWKIFIEQNHLTDKISDETISQVVEKFNTIAGRDIRNIISLVSKYSMGNKLNKIDFEVFKLCATFRGIYSIGDKDDKDKKCQN